MMRIAREKGILDFNAYDLRDWTHDRHRTTDDYPYGGGHGLLMKCDPVFEALEDILDIPSGTLPLDQGSLHKAKDGCRTVFMSPHGRLFDDAYATELAGCEHLLFVCGHYEGMDERVYSVADEMVSLGDYVLTSGELASMVVIDAVVRKLPGVLGAEMGAFEESFSNGLLEHPQYTRPAVFRGMEVPEVLLSGHHRRIGRWQREQSLAATYRLRPDLLEEFLAGDDVTDEDCVFLKNMLDAQA